MSENQFPFLQDCALMQYLGDLSSHDGHGLNGEYAGALLAGLGFPARGWRPPDLAFTAQVIAAIKEDNRHTNLVAESAKKCLECPHLGDCQVGELFQTDRTRQ